MYIYVTKEPLIQPVRCSLLGEGTNEQIEQIKKICKPKFPKYRSKDGGLVISYDPEACDPFYLFADGNYSEKETTEFSAALTAAIDFVKEQENEQAKAE